MIASEGHRTLPQHSHSAAELHEKRMKPGMRKTYGYDPYRGRSPFRTILKIVAAALALILALAVAALFFLEPYWVYGPDGPHLQLPWEGQTPPVSTASPSPSPTVVIVETEAPSGTPLHAVALPQELLWDPAAVQEQVAAAGANAALFDMKGDDGLLGYTSSLELAQSAGVSGQDAGLNEAIAALNAQEDLYTVARVSCCRDNSMPRQRNDLAIRSSSGNWVDQEGTRWLSPSSQEARQYLSGVCLELAALGFDEILLDNAAFPTSGELERITQGGGGDTASSVLAGFYAEVRQTVRDRYPDVRLSVTASGTALASSETDPSGQTPSLLASSGLDRIWVRDAADSSEIYQALTQQGFSGGAAGLVSILAEPGGEDISWCVWWGQSN